MMIKGRNPLFYYLSGNSELSTRESIKAKWKHEYSIYRILVAEWEIQNMFMAFGQALRTAFIT
jgi:hypothetical protein